MAERAYHPKTTRMSKLLQNPYLNGIYAEAYIIAVVWILDHVGAPDTPDTFFAPVAALSLFVLSVAVMGSLLLGEPARLYLDGKKKPAAAFFVRTLLGFAAITVFVLLIVSGQSR